MALKPRSRPRIRGQRNGNYNNRELKNYLENLGYLNAQSASATAEPEQAEVDQGSTFDTGEEFDPFNTVWTYQFGSMYSAGNTLRHEDDLYRQILRS